MNVTFEGNSATGKNQWLTPPELLAKLGQFDLDPCAPINRPWPTATQHYTIEDDGLKQPWFGRCWVNPPYDTQLIIQFIERCVEHKNAIALTFPEQKPSSFRNSFLRKHIRYSLSRGDYRFIM